MSENTFDAWLSELDLDFWGTGQHKISVEELLRHIEHGEPVMLLDLRTPEEKRYWALPFATSIAIDELPARWQELPRDTLIATFCPHRVRAAIAYAYLHLKGLERVRVLDATASDLIGNLMPGQVRKLRRD